MTIAIGLVFVAQPANLLHIGIHTELPAYLADVDILVRVDYRGYLQLSVIENAVTYYNLSPFSDSQTADDIEGLRGSIFTD